MWHGDLRELPLLAADFRFGAIRSSPWAGDLCCEGRANYKTGAARLISGVPARGMDRAGWGKAFLSAFPVPPNLLERRAPRERLPQLLGRGSLR